MRDLRLIDIYRVTDPAALEYSGGWSGDERCGAFMVPSKMDHQPLCVIASNAEGWDHVSVSRKTRCPNWFEMCQIKELFFLDGETAMQLHPPEADYVNNHPYCLHLWRPHSETIPRPPSILVGIKSAGILQSPAQARALRQKMETKTS